MKKLMAILVLAGVLSIPSAVFAEASWYGSLRAGVESSGGNIGIVDVGSRWGIRGTVEAGEGITASYVFEHGLNTANTAWGSGRLGSVGLSGGFGSITFGQIWSASFNSVGAITDNSTWFGASHTSARQGQVASYAFSNDLMALQVDASYGEGALEDNPNDDLEQVEFGLSVNIGDIGKVAVAHTDDKYSVTDVDESETRNTDDTQWSVKTTTVAGQISVSDLTVYVGSQNAKNACDGVVQSDDTLNACDQSTAGQVDNKSKTTFFGFRGGLGDTGVNYLFQWRDRKATNTKPWMLGLYKGLGGGASINLEHANNDGASDNATRVWLRVNF